MKRRLFTLILLFGFIPHIYGQMPVYAQMPDSLKEYYSLTNKAELAIVDSNYTEAIEFYSRAFSFKANAFKKDIYNQALCAVLIKDYRNAYYNFKDLINYGYILDSLTNRKELIVFFHSKYGKKLIAHNKKNKALYNVPLRETYDSLYKADQSFRKKTGGYDVYGDTIQKIDISNADKVQKLIGQYGFPSQNLIGVYPDFSYRSIFTLIIHNNAGNRLGQYLNYTAILYNAVYSGKLDSRVGSQLISGSTGNDYYGFEVTGLVKQGLDTTNNVMNKTSKLTNWGFYKLSRHQEQEYDKRRAEIGLCPIEENRNKTIYNLKDNVFHLTTVGNRKINYWLYEKDYEKAVNNTIFIK